MLQEDQLQLDGVLEGVAVVLHFHGAAAARGQPVRQRLVGLGLPERRPEPLAGQAEPSGFSPVRGRQNDEGAVAMLGL